MNDEELVARLRSALDEIVATPNDPFDEPSGPLVGMRSTSTRMTTARWMATAAAVVLVAGGVTAMVLRRSGDHPGTAPLPSGLSTTATLDTTPVTPTSVLLEFSKAAWYTLALGGDFTPGQVTIESCCVPRPEADTVVAWADTSGIEHGLLLLTDHRAGLDPTAALTYTYAGMTAARAAALEAQVVPGSGLPYVLPDPSMRFLASGMGGAGALVSQSYTSGGSQVGLAVGDYRGQLDALTHGELHGISVAATTGYRADDDLGTTVVWRTPAGTWATLHIGIALSKDIDTIVAALRPAPLPGAAPPTTNSTLYVGVGTIIDDGSGPKLAFVVEQSLPPRGGDIPLAGFDWAQVTGVQSRAGVTWTTGVQTVTGRWDGTVFTLTEPPKPGTPNGFPPAPTHNVMTDGCTLATMAPMLDALGHLNFKALHIIETSSYNYEGHCGVAVGAAFDTPEFRDAMAKVGSDVTVWFGFEPLA